MPCISVVVVIIYTLIMTEGIVRQFRVFTRKTMSHRVFRFDYCTQEITLIRCLAWNVRGIIKRYFARKESIRAHYVNILGHLKWHVVSYFSLRLTPQSDRMLLDKYWLDNFNMSHNAIVLILFLSIKRQILSIWQIQVTEQTISFLIPSDFYRNDKIARNTWSWYCYDQKYSLFNYYDIN